MKRLFKRLMQSVPALNQLLYVKGAIKGHFYSPVPGLSEIRSRRAEIFDNVPQDIGGGVELNETRQMELARELSERFYSGQPFSEEFLSNDAFPYCDAITLYSMLRYSKPRRVIEVGSGYSSRVTLETNKLFLDNSVKCTFIEPYPFEQFRAWTNQYPSAALIEKRVQDVPLEIFRELKEADILFIDSSHVAKVGSDVNHIFFNILPVLQPGVRIHFHDIFYPFEYPEEWILREGKAWNEAYLLRAFLQFNRTYGIEYWPSYLVRFHSQFFEAKMPSCLKSMSGSIWLKKLSMY